MRHMTAYTVCLKYVNIYMMSEGNCEDTHTHTCIFTHISVSINITGSYEYTPTSPIPFQHSEFRLWLTLPTCDAPSLTEELVPSPSLGSPCNVLHSAPSLQKAHSSLGSSDEPPRPTLSQLRLQPSTQASFLHSLFHVQFQRPI